MLGNLQLLFQVLSHEAAKQSLLCVLFTCLLFTRPIIHCPYKHIQLYFAILLGITMWFVLGTLDDNNQTELFQGLADDQFPQQAINSVLRKVTPSPIIKSSFIKVSTVWDILTGRIPEIDIQNSHQSHPTDPPRAPNVILPQAFPWRCCRSHRKRGPRQYHLRLRI